MSKTYFWSDLHLGHSKMYTLPFTSIHNEQEPMRPFSSCEEADAYIINQYNTIVKPGDKVYFLGDVALSKKGLYLMSQMQKGHNYLVMGNHDNQAPITEYTKFFNKIYGALYMRAIKSICTHIPINSNFPDHRFSWNIHGHLHDKIIKDPIYINVSVEQTGYKPITFEEALSNYKHVAKSQD